MDWHIVDIIKGETRSTIDEIKDRLKQITKKHIKESKISVKDYINSIDKELEIKNFSRLSLS